MSAILASYEQNSIFEVFVLHSERFFGDSHRSWMKFCLVFGNSLWQRTEYLIIQINAEREVTGFKSGDRAGYGMGLPLPIQQFASL